MAIAGKKAAELCKRRIAERRKRGIAKHRKRLASRFNYPIFSWSKPCSEVSETNRKWCES